VVGIHTTQEVQDGSSILRNTMVWPSCEMELDHPSQTVSFLCGREKREVGKGEAKMELEDHEMWSEQYS